LIFPSVDHALDNLLFAKFIEPQNQIIDLRVFYFYLDRTSQRIKSLAKALHSNHAVNGKIDQSVLPMPSKLLISGKILEGANQGARSFSSLPKTLQNTKELFLVIQFL